LLPRPAQAPGGVPTEDFAGLAIARRGGGRTLRVNGQIRWPASPGAPHVPTHRSHPDRRPGRDAGSAAGLLQDRGRHPGVPSGVRGVRALRGRDGLDRPGASAAGRTRTAFPALSGRHNEERPRPRSRTHLCPGLRT